MDVELSEEEFAALLKKAGNPMKDVRCPRCGAELNYRDIGNSYEVKCKTEGCIKLTSRGL